MADDLGPPPPPKKVKMPPMPDHIKKKYGESDGGPKPGGGAPASMPPMMSGAPMMGGGAPAGMPMMGGGAVCGGYPTIGGMGPNLVFNFSSPGYGTPYCYPMQAVPAAGEKKDGKKEKKEEKKEETKEVRKVYVQGKPTFANPRLVAKIGKQREEPCVIM